MKKRLNTIYTKVFLCAILVFNLGCEKFVIIDPPITSLSGNMIFEEEDTATAAILSIYHDISNSYDRPFQGEQSLSWMSYIMSDDFINYFTDNRLEFANNQITPQNLILQRNWAALYQDIYRANKIIEEIPHSKKLSKVFKQSLEGEARFLRALMYFYLVNFWENVPLVLETDYTIVRVKSQSKSEEIYQQIINDLIIANELLTTPIQFFNKSRANKYAVKALLSKVYLFTQQWENAEKLSSQIINSGNFELEEDLNHVFLNTSKEVIWHIKPVNPSINTWDGYRFILSGRPTAVSLSESLLNSFEDNDLRKTCWVGNFWANDINYYFPNKYKVKLSIDPNTALQEYLVMFRLSEQYLIRAESKGRLGDLDGALNDLNEVRIRAGINPYSKLSQDELIQKIFHEKRLEFFSEGSNRWFDLRRIGQLKKSVLPIPEVEILYNPNLIQNLGY